MITLFLVSVIHRNWKPELVWYVAAIELCFDAVVAAMVRAVFQ